MKKNKIIFSFSAFLIILLGFFLYINNVKPLEAQQCPGQNCCAPPDTTLNCPRPQIESVIRSSSCSNANVGAGGSAAFITAEVWCDIGHILTGCTASFNDDCSGAAEGICYVLGGHPRFNGSQYGCIGTARTSDTRHQVVVTATCARLIPPAP